MKYCIATFIFPRGYKTELLLKGRSISFIEEQIKRYVSGWISTSNLFIIVTRKGNRNVYI
ncbi:hypothetical protein ABE28_009340 [Peribacillus muralis]|uniref:Uncharacterized protein n=1 Tax=Peribacillus muralis TaxID=264697 RepID=A0A1B3XMV4_9BACI|nr:hypothetical protein ABE28_009340 [Peribacillus muralis]